MTFYLTNQSLINLKNKVEEIEHRLKHDVAKEIGKAADLGDLSENAEWEAAIELQRNLQHEVSRLKEKIRTAQIIEELPVSGDKVFVSLVSNCISSLSLFSLAFGLSSDIFLLLDWTRNISKTLSFFKSKK